MTRTLLLLSMLLVLGEVVSAGEPNLRRTEDVIYDRKFGTALTMDVFTPTKHANGAAIVWAVSGGWFSSHQAISPIFVQEFIKRGYTVFAVVHRSQPKFTIPDAIAAMTRAVRFIRHNAQKFKIDPERIGITGGSAGGHLSLMIGMAGDKGNPRATDAVERAASRVQAVACFYPPTDFLNYGEKGRVVLGNGVLANFKAPFAFQEFDPKSRSFEPITDEKKILEIGKQISPVYHVTPDDAPALIIHGDADKLVPIQQAQLIIGKLNEAKVPCKLVVREGKAHGWPNLLNDLTIFGDWFDVHLKAK
ncbi:MAG: alpha/beta hydrolase [Planctomycetes bacterium]|nr:alpha/beta hydrolase [Planctomycetota bacterium]